MIEMTNCIAIGVADKRDTAERWKELGFQIGKEGGEWIEVFAGPLRLYFVEDGTRDIAFAFTSADLDGARQKLEDQGYTVDKNITDRVGEMFLRDPDRHLFNLSEPPSFRKLRTCPSKPPRRSRQRALSCHRELCPRPHRAAVVA